MKNPTLDKLVSKAFNMAILLFVGVQVLLGAIVYLIGYLLSK
jgi:hypothetical protein